VFGAHRFDLLSESFHDLSGIERRILDSNALCGLYTSNWRLSLPGSAVARSGIVWNCAYHSQKEALYP
jgi:hypothetical protein